MLYERFKQGINLGGYLSQYELVTDMSSVTALQDHFATFIRQADLDRIASWGFDHVRIPLDGYLFFDPERGQLKSEPMAALDRCLQGCQKARLNAVLDLHNFWGHQYGRMDEPTQLMLDETIRADFCTFWQRMAEHYQKHHQIEIMFELFNEMADATGYRWNQLYREAVKAIRAADANRWILVGSNNVNSVAYLDRLDLLEDPLVFYNFHYYEPNAFTHQNAHFSEEFRAFRKSIDYPGDMREYLAFLAQNPRYQLEHELITHLAANNDSALMKRLLTGAEKFVRYSGKELYCGEFGVINTALEENAVRWLRDFIAMCDSMRVGHAMWNYKCLDFELVDERGDVVRPKIVRMFQDIHAD